MPEARNSEVTIAKKEKYNSLDLFKFVMALCVVAIHTNPMADCTSTLAVLVYDTVLNCAVPFFFLVSGYLLASKMTWPYDQDDSLALIHEYIISMLKLYLFWSLIYLPLRLKDYVNAGCSLADGIIHYFLNLVFVGGYFSTEFLWYLLSSIYGMLMVALCLKRRISPYGIVCIGFLVMLAGMGINHVVGFESFCGLDHLAPQLSALLLKGLEILRRLVTLTIKDGRILTGAFYLPCGMLLACKRIPSKVNAVVFCLVFFACCLTDSFTLRRLLLIAVSVTLFQIVLSIKLSDHPVYPFLRRMSRMIYFLHVLVLMVLRDIGWLDSGLGLKCFSMTAAFTIAVSFFFVQAENMRTKEKQGRT